MAALTRILERFRDRTLNWGGWRKTFHRRPTGHRAAPDERVEHEDHISQTVGRTQHEVERLARGVLIAFGFVFAVADLTGVFNWLPHWFIPDVTLFILCTVTLYLVLDTRNARAVGHAIGKIDAVLSKLDRDYCGVVKVTEHFNNDAFNEYICDAQHEVAILNTWAPNLGELKDSLETALSKGVDVRVLLLHPLSLVVQLREDALRAARHTEDSEDLERGEADVRKEVFKCLDILEGIYFTSLSCRQHLRVRLYNSLPAISLYKADERYLVGVFTHGRLAIESPQFEVAGKHTKVGEMAQRELEMLWEIGKDDFDMRNWRRSLENG